MPRHLHLPPEPAEAPRQGKPLRLIRALLAAASALALASA